MASWGVMEPLVMSSSSESVSAMPILSAPQQGHSQIRQTAQRAAALTRSRGRTRSTPSPWCEKVNGVTSGLEGWLDG